MERGDLLAKYLFQRKSVSCLTFNNELKLSSRNTLSDLVYQLFRETKVLKTHLYEITFKMIIRFPNMQF